MAARLADHLNAARRQRFVGRESECSLFQSAIHAEEFPFYVLYIHGPGGVGKTSLLSEFETICNESNIQTIQLDGRNIEPSPEAFLLTIQTALKLGSSDSVVEAIAFRHQKTVMFIDTYEKLTPLDDWIREVFLPQLPEHILIVLAGRNEPSSGWRTDAGWQTLIRTVALRNLSPDEGRTYLNWRNVPSEQHEAVLSFTRGHPLALSLVADTLDQRPDPQFHPDNAPDVVRTLLERFVQKVPGPAHRTALEVCALLYTTTESLLAEMLNIQDAHELFSWMCRLSFIESGRVGVFPHDLARDAMIADLRWRNPDWYAELHRRAREYYKKRMQQTQGEEQRRVLIEYVFLHRLNPVIQPAIEWQEHGTVWNDTLKESDIPKLVEMITHHEGKESAEIAFYFLNAGTNRNVVSTIVLRDAHQEPAGFLLSLSLEDLTKDDLKIDIAAKKALEFLKQKASLRPGERATLFRFWMAKEQYQSFSPVQSRIFTSVFQYYFSTPDLAFSFFPAANAEQWTPLFTYAEILPIPELQFEVGGKQYMLYGHDWRAMPISQWLEVLGKKEMGMTAAPATVPATEQIVVLSETSFASAVRDALKDICRPDALSDNPLLRSRLIIAKAGTQSKDDERIDILIDLIKSSAESLQASPREAKFYKAIYRTYLNPAQSQELAAETLNLPFSTYRRYLKSGVTRITDILWQKEINSTEK